MMDQPRNPARARLAEGALSLGIGIRLARTAEVAKLMKSCGFDWLFIDLEHGATSLESAAQISAAALDTGIAPLVRVPEMQLDMATRALDNGAWGIVMPHVDTAEEAKEIVDKLKYPPAGHRSIIGGLPHYGYRHAPAAEVAKTLNAETLVVAMLETPAAIENAAAIAAVPGIDVLLVGSNDLAMEMGIPGQIGDARITAAYEKTIAAAKRHGKYPGMGGVSQEDILRRAIGMGMRFILGGNDLPLLLNAGTGLAKMLRGCLQGP